ncbi:MAG: nucleoside deaminase [Planctomycetaceae bacterium]|nr:nucleoside deaminase [Planctomycetaceae bacterium]
MNKISPSLHEIMMRHAILIARQNPTHPFGTVIVNDEGDVIAEGVNRGAENPILHGEIDAINECAKEHQNEDWSKFILYSTAEPCPMCMSAILWSGIPAVIYGTSIATLKELGWRQISINSQEVIARSWDPELAIRGGVLEEDCDRLFESASENRSS